MKRQTHQSGGRESAQPRVQSRLLRVFVLQLALISIITVAGIFAASLVAERILVKQALVGEANYFWKRRLQDPEFALPNTLNLQSYFSSADHEPDLPADIAALPPGQHRIIIAGDDRIVHVSEEQGQRLYLLFQDETVSNLAFYFGVLPLTLVLITMYSLAFLAYWLSKRAVSPIVRLADVIEQFDFNARDASELDLADLPGPKDSETVVLAQALEHFVKRSKDSIERERNFTRYASHELRTPIAVIQGSISSLELLTLKGAPARAVARIKRSSEHMADLINSLLLLARGKTRSDDIERVDVNQLLLQLIDEVKSVNSHAAAAIELKQQTNLTVSAPTVDVSIVLGNILRNACNYASSGRIIVKVEQNKVSISDNGPGLSEDQQRRVFEPFYRGEADSISTAPGLGLGLAIVRHVCDNQGWKLSVRSVLGEGATFEVIFVRHPVK